MKKKGNSHTHDDNYDYLYNNISIIIKKEVGKIRNFFSFLVLLNLPTIHKQFLQHKKKTLNE